ncbi:aminoglycoside phosphotransferase family protein [Gymnodinialimonas ulvae]|uniref:aminoglycoside phosphotransferase family protein n=1 Tax=Gymnodinialimonas ulvae TaxID=3126504 RepID=UPI0030A1B085
MIEGFLEQHGWGQARRASLAGDASTRRYTRLIDGARRAMLMEDHDADNLARFLRMSAHLRGLELSAPDILAEDQASGCLLIEDFGDLTLSRLLRDDPDTARRAYRVTTAMLPRLNAAPPSDLAAPDPAEMAEMVGLTFDFIPESQDLRAQLLPVLAEAIAENAPGPPVLSLRDVHGDNLIWLPERDGDARIGLLDYQDAMLLPDGYDLASLLDDPRREIPEEWHTLLVDDMKRFATLSLQRNLRILGIFHRLAVQYGKPRYRAYLPRTRALISRAAGRLPSLRTPVAALLDRTAHWIAS